MSDGGRRFFSGESLERAILEAAGHFGIAPRQLRFEPVEKQGLTKRRRVVIRVDPDQPTRPSDEADEAGRTEALPRAREARATPVATAAAPDAEPVAEGARLELPAPEETAQGTPPEAEIVQAASNRAEGSPSQRARPASVERHARDGRHLPATVRARFEGLLQAPAEIERIAQRWLDAIFALAGLDLECEIRRSAEQLEIEVFGKDREALVEDEGEMITAIQHLMPRLLTVEMGEAVGVRIDSNGMRELREEELRRRAQEAAREVRSTGEVVVLEPLPPADRRIVHMAVADDATVATESVGRGFFRRVTIRPA